MAVSNNPIEQKIPASAAVDVEYKSPDQHGGIYGVVFRQYFGATLPAGLTSGDPVSKLIDYVVRASFSGDSSRYVTHGWSDDGTDFILINLSGTSGNGNLTLSKGVNFTIQSGWVDYIKAVV